MSTLGRTPIGVNQPPSSGSVYPFLSPSYDIQNLLGDFYLSYEDVTCNYQYPFRIVWMYGFGTNIVTPPDGFDTPINEKDIIIVDANDNIVFDSTLASYSDSVWGDRLLIIEWQQIHQVCRCTMYTAWEDSEVSRTYDNYIVPQDGSLDPRTCNRLPSRVRSVTVGLQTFTGNIQFEAGYNIQQTVTVPKRVDGSRFVNQINLDVVPGAGLGQQPGCQDTQIYIRTINQIQPDASGNFIFQLDSCFRSQLPLFLIDTNGYKTAEYSAEGYTAEQSKSAILLHNDCQPCCECDYYVRVYRGLKRMWAIWTGIAVDAEAVRDTYNNNIQRWLNALACRVDNSLNVVLSSEPGCNNFIGATYCNASKCCIAPVEIRLTIQGYTNGILDPSLVSSISKDSFITASSTDGEVPYVPDISGPVIRFTADSANPQTTVMIRTKVCSTCSSSSQTIKVTVTAHTPDPPPAPITGDTCVLPTPTVPSDILSIWAANDVPATPTVRAIIQKASPLNTTPNTYTCGC